MGQMLHGAAILTLLALLQDVLGGLPHTVSFSVESSATGSSFHARCTTQRCHEVSEFEYVPSFQELGKSDGIAVTILNEKTGVVLLKKTFSTWNVFTYGHDLAWWLSRVKAGRVVVMRVHRAGTYGIEAALPVLEHFGSLLARFAPPRAFWIWAFVAGGKTMLETIAPTPSRHSMQRELLGDAFFQVSSNEISSNLYSRLCESEASMGPICDGDKFNQIMSMESKRSDDPVNKIGVVVCAGGRVQYLAHTILKLLDNKLMPSNILVVVGRTPSGEANNAVITLLKLLHIQYEIAPIPKDVPSVNHGLFQFYRRAWTAGVKTFSNLRYIAFLDEDVEVSPDWLEMLAHFAMALDTDPSLWCISGSAPGHRNMFPDPRIFLRGFRQPGWGYMFSLSEARSMVSKWPESSNVSLLYDTFLYRVMSRGRECLFPALSRTHHYGVGVNTIPEVHQLYFLDQPLHTGQKLDLPSIKEITQEGYERKVLSSLRNATPITRNPCAPGFLIPPKNRKQEDFVFYFFMVDPEDSPEWTTLAECLGAWPYSTQSHHHGCFQMPQPWGGSLWIVGTPYSKYSSLRPPEIPIWKIKSEKDLYLATRFSNSLRIPLVTNRNLSLAIPNLFL